MKPPKPPRAYLESPHLLTFLLLAAVAWSLFAVNWDGPLVHTGGGQSALRFLLALFPPDLSPDFLLVCLNAAWQTLAFALAGITIAVLIGFPLGVVASGALLSPNSRFRLPVILAVRFVLGALRSIHELVWAVLFVAAIGLSPLAAIFALGSALRRYSGPYLCRVPGRHPGRTPGWPCVPPEHPRCKPCCTGNCPCACPTW